MPRSVRTVRVRCAAACVGLVLGFAATNAVASSYMITDVNVVDVVRGALRPHQTVRIRDDRIVSVTPARPGEAASGFEVVDGRGRFLSPGFIDMHAHLNYRQQTQEIAPKLSPSDDDLLSAHQLSLFLCNGVTTIQVMHGERNMLKVRDRIASGEVRGPRLVVASPRLDGYPPANPLVRLVLGRAEAIAIVDELKATGYDLIKVYDQLDEETYDAIVTRAHEVGLRVDGHLPRTLPLSKGLDHRQDHVAHIEEFVGYAGSGSDAEVDEVAAKVRASGIGVTPTLTVFRNVLRSVSDLPGLLADPERRFADPIVYRSWLADENPYQAERFQTPEVKAALERQYGLMKRLTLAFAKAGVPLSVGSDCTVSGTVCGFSLHDEMAELVGLGLTPAAVLRMDTVNAAAALHRDKDLGAVEPGMIADLVLLEGDPLADIANTRRIAGVFTHGAFLSRSDLRSDLSDALAAFKALDRRLGMSVVRPTAP